MSWDWALGLGLGVLALAGASWFFGIGRIVAIFRTLLDLVLDGVRWLRGPGAKLKAVCGLLAFACMVFGLQSFTRAHTIREQRIQYVLLEGQVDQLKGQVTDRDERISQFAALAEEQFRLLEQQQGLSAKALDTAYQAGLKAGQSAAQFKTTYDQRTPECDTALRVMAKACPALRDY